MTYRTLNLLFLHAAANQKGRLTPRGYEPGRAVFVASPDPSASPESHYQAALWLLGTTSPQAQVAVRLIGWPARTPDQAS